MKIYENTALIEFATGRNIVQSENWLLLENEIPIKYRHVIFELHNEELIERTQISKFY